MLVRILAVIAGIIIIFYALGEIILRLFIALVGLWLIRYGLKQYNFWEGRAFNWHSSRRF